MSSFSNDHPKRRAGGPSKSEKVAQEQSVQGVTVEILKGYFGKEHRRLIYYAHNVREAMNLYAKDPKTSVKTFSKKDKNRMVRLFGF
ncbi:hypothetical protein H6771_00675 [Candidatus Peribacteria bacterium]|nr:hypothetical protein [Candidatus Peribacteria bacterium]